MSTGDLNKVSKNKYFLPVLILIIAIGGFFIGQAVSNKGDEKSSEEEEIELKEGSSDSDEKSGLKGLIFGEEEYELSYNGMDSSLVENISFFESDETWKGSGFLDKRTFYEGGSSIAVDSENHKAGAISLEKDSDLSGIKTLEFFVSVNDVDSLESVMVKLGDSSLKNYYSYSLLNLKNGWNFIRIPEEKFVLVNKDNPDFGWKDIQKIYFYVMSRPDCTVMANFDYLTAQKDIECLDKWNTKGENFLSLGKNNDKIVLIARNEGGLQGTLKGVNGNDFSFQASFIPQKAGKMGLFFRGDYNNNYGYYLFADGINQNSCTLAKYSKKDEKNEWEDLDTVDIVNFVFEKDKKYWLRVETKGDKITCLLSDNGENFTELFSVNDSDFDSGGVGIAVSNRSYGFFDDFSFRQ